MRELTKQTGNNQNEIEEPVWYLLSVPYSQYRQSHHWLKLCRKYKQHLEDSLLLLQCELCGMSNIFDEKTGDELLWIPQFHVHHKTYFRLGMERFEDLALVCSACHNLIHFPESAAAKYWLAYSATDYRGPIDLALLEQMRPPELK